MFINSPSFKTFCVVVTLSFTLTHQYKLLEFPKYLFLNVEKQNHEKNVIISPLSVEALIGILRIGAKGETAAELNKPIRDEYQNLDENSIRAYYRPLTMFLKLIPGATIANKLYIDENLHVKEEYKTLLTDEFYSSIEAVDFSSPEETAASINEWVKTKTKNLIPQLVQPDTFTEDTKLFLVNAITFSGEWKFKFNEADTQLADFYLDEHKSIKVPMMHQKGIFLTQYHPNLKATSLTLPYAAVDLSFVIYLPDTYADFYYLDNQIKHIYLNDLESGQEAYVYLYLPKFEVEFDYDLKNVLQNMGLRKSFSDSGDFGGFLESNDTLLSVPKFIHKVVINVDEKGSNSAPDTKNSNNYNFKIFNANRSFIYFVTDVFNNVVFSGSYKGLKN